MEKAIGTKLENGEWYQNLIEECKAILVETEFSARLEIIKGKWLLGERLLQENENFERRKIYGKEIVSRVAESLKISPRELWRCVQFARKYPNLVRENEVTLEPFLEGKNISWRKIANRYLPEPESKEEVKCSHLEIDEVCFLRCKNCGENLEGHSRIIFKEDLINRIENWAKENHFPQFPLEFNKEGKPWMSIPAGKENWEGYLQKNSLPTIWKLYKRIEEKR